MEAYRDLGLDLAEGELAGGGPLRLEVRGDSMLPALRPGDRVLLQPVAPGDLRMGDLVAVRRGRQAVTHRVIGRRAGAWLLKGDNRWRADPPLDPGRLLGKVVAVEGSAGAALLEGEAGRYAARMVARFSSGEARLDELGRRLLPGRAGAALARPMALLLRFIRLKLTP